MSCNKQSINPRPSCGHRHASVGCGTSVCGQKTHHFGVESKTCEVECVPFEASCAAVWVSPAPESVQDAIDRLAATVYAVYQDPIPQIGGGTGANGVFGVCPPILP